VRIGAEQSAEPLTVGSKAATGHGFRGTQVENQQLAAASAGGVTPMMQQYLGQAGKGFPG
jgi:hypothetical protein